jgi:hypothetical protein
MNIIFMISYRHKSFMKNTIDQRESMSSFARNFEQWQYDWINVNNEN